MRQISTKPPCNYHVGNLRIANILGVDSFIMCNPVPQCSRQPARSNAMCLQHCTHGGRVPLPGDGMGVGSTELEGGATHPAQRIRQPVGVRLRQHRVPLRRLILPGPAHRPPPSPLPARQRSRSPLGALPSGSRPQLAGNACPVSDLMRRTCTPPGRREFQRKKRRLRVCAVSQAPA